MAQSTTMVDDEYEMMPLSEEQQKRIEKFTPVSPLFSERPSLIDKVVRHVCVKRAMSAPPEHDMVVYTLRGGFLPCDRYWVTKVGQERMKQSSQVLYRPNITSKLIERVEALLIEYDETGIMVKGPQGVGKSFLSPS